MLTTLLSGCMTTPLNTTTSIDIYQSRTLSDQEAIVLIGIDSDIPFSAVEQSCSFPCIALKYELSGRKEIMAFVARVGSAFQLNRILTKDRRYADLNGEEIKIDKRGVYYYGTISGTSQSVAIRKEVSTFFLSAAQRKYGARFADLPTVNFSWPNLAEDDRLGFDYKNSAVVQKTLQAYEGKSFRLTTINPPERFNANCRTSGPLPLPNFLPYEKYIQRAFNDELRAAQIYGEKSGAMLLKGSVTELVFNSNIGAANWKIGLRIEAPGGQSATFTSVMPFQAGFGGVIACADTENAFPDAVQKLIESVVAAPEFRAILSAPVPAR